MKLPLRKLTAFIICLALCPISCSAEEIRSGTASADGKKRIALTFDDGPHAVYTEEILDLLKEYGIHATFFIIGENAVKYPDLVRREIQEGHEVGNHTMTHPALNGISSAELVTQLRKTDDVLYALTQKHPTLFRPPTGLCTAAVRNAADTMKYDLILWSVDTRDWSKKSSLEHIINEVRANARDGSIILFHDYTVRKDHATVTALKALIPWLIDSGYEFVTVSSLLT